MKTRVFGFELHGVDFEVRWEPPTVAEGNCAGPRVGPVRVWLYETGLRVRAIGSGFWNGDLLMLRPVNVREIGRELREAAEGCLRTELQP